MLECVVNISEGRDTAVIAALAAACGRALLDVHTDPDHHRSVFTLAGPAERVSDAASALARAAIERIDLTRHAGVHPRLGVVDVVPFVPLEPLSRSSWREPASPAGSREDDWPGTGRDGPAGLTGPGDAEDRRRAEGSRTGEDPTIGRAGHATLRGAEGSPTGEDRTAGRAGDAGLRGAVEVARAWAERAARDLGVPVFLYGAADRAGSTLPDVRRTAFRGRGPDFGPPEPHPTAGAMAVGARPVLVAVNCELAPGGDPAADLALARAVARTVRERDGGLAGVRALGFALASRGRAQVSMNLTDLAATGVEAACEAVRRAAADGGGRVAAVELVGLLPAAEFDRCGREFLAWSRLSPEQTIEARLAAGANSG